MAARAMWKGVISFADIHVPVKLYAAVEDRGVHFRLLHRKDHRPVKQYLLNPETDETIPSYETSRAFISDSGDMVLLGRDELEALEPEKSREIQIISFLPPSEIDHRWYDRPYYLGPDGSSRDYFTLIDALESTGLEGLAHWVMRNKEYFGALRLHQGYPMLMSLHSAQEVIPVEALEPPSDDPLDKRELAMAHNLIEMLEATFDPDEYNDEYRTHLIELIQAKVKGTHVKQKPPRASKRVEEDLSGALAASLKKFRKSA